MSDNKPQDPKFSLNNEAPVPVQNNANTQQINQYFDRPTRKPTGRLTIAVILLVSLVVGLLLFPMLEPYIRGIASTPITPTNATVQPGNIPTAEPTFVPTTPQPSIASPTASLATPVNATTAMEYYRQYTSQPPTQEYTPANSSQWSNGTPAYGSCESKNPQEYHAFPAPHSIVACIAPSPTLTNDYAVQVMITVLQGAGAGLAFGFSPSNTVSGTYYYWSFCRLAGCPPQGVFLYHGSSNGTTRCLGPGAGPGYTSDPHYCNVTSSAVQDAPGQPNILTIIVLHSEIYLYVNSVFILAINPIYSTDGQVGIAALAGQYPGVTDVSFQYLKIWQIQD